MMSKKLEFSPISIRDILKRIRIGLESERDSTWVANSKTTTDHVNRWINQNNDLLQQISNIEATVLPGVQSDLGFRFDPPDLFYLALFHGTTSNLFREINTFSSGRNFPVSPEELSTMASLEEVARSLAYIGDAALKMGAAYYGWTQPTPTPEQLDILRSKHGDNAVLANLCDKWGLYENLICFKHERPTKEDTLNKEKGTRVEAIFGILFISRDLEAVIQAIPLVKLKC